jgi:hypothetical protein
MSDQTINPDDGIQLLRSYLLHCRYVRRGLRRVENVLSERGDAHDDSKLWADEFAGFSRINKVARESTYGSPEYRAGLKQEKPTIDQHYERNSHHPEYHGDVNTDGERGPAAQSMTWLDLIEMVCDWYGAYLAYGAKGTWAANMQVQRERYGPVGRWFTAGQWWLIEQVAQFVAG